MRRIFTLSLPMALLGALLMIGSASAQEAPTFTGGFADLTALAPDQVGQPLEDPQADADGNVFQLTTGGLLAWDKATNIPSFTDGSTTLVLGPLGLEERINDTLFAFETMTPDGQRQLLAEVQTLQQQQDQLAALANQTTGDEQVALLDQLAQVQAQIAALTEPLTLA